MRNTLLLAAAALMLAACQPSTTENAAADDTATPASPTTGQSETPPAYVGRWAAEISWCANTLGPERPIEVTATEFRGYENTCQITDLTTAEGGWAAVFVCQAEGQTTTQPVRMEANANRLEIAWQTDGYDVEWRRCPA